jgi:hypothetical protein
MILRMLRATEWGQLVDFVSPAFFEVMPARALARTAKELIASTRDQACFLAVAAALRERLAERDVALRLALDEPSAVQSAPGRGSRRARTERGQIVLRLYFEQLLGADAALLDLRGVRFASREGSLAWWPSRGFVRWDPAFLDGVRRMYRGFYGGCDAEFRAGLAALELDAAADLFLSHFGAGDQTSVRFEMAHFTASFHSVFVRCRAQGVRLHPNFVALGIYLAALYEHLEALAVPLDVRAAFAAAAA